MCWLFSTGLANSYCPPHWQTRNFMNSPRRNEFCGPTLTTKRTSPNFRKLCPCGALVVLHANASKAFLYNPLTDGRTPIEWLLSHLLFRFSCEAPSVLDS